MTTTDCFDPLGHSTAFDERVGDAACGFELAGLDVVGAADLPPGVLELREEVLGVLDVKAAAIDADGKRGIEAVDGGLIVDGAEDEVVFVGVWLHAFGLVTVTLRTG